MTTITTLDDFWTLIDQANFDFSRLDAELASLDRAGLENFHGLTTILAWDACIEDVLFYEAAGIPLSEDGMEDFGWWAVKQGRSFHDELTEGVIPLQDALAMHMGDKEPRAGWKPGANRRYRNTNLLSLAEEVCKDRFGDWAYGQENAIRQRAYTIRDQAYA